MNPRRVDLVGTTFGQGVVTEFIGQDPKWKTRRWKLVCSCGEEYTATTGNLRAGHVCSCGHLVGDARRAYGTSRRGVSRIGYEDAVYNEYERQYRGEGWAYHLTREEFIRLVSGDCEYCGQPPMSPKYARANRAKDGRSQYYGEPVLTNGIDRVDPSSGYTPDNCVSCCTMCNYAKRDNTREEFEEWITRAYNHLHDRR